MFCAICTADIIGAPHLEPLGKNGAIVNVCVDCATSPATEKFGPERAYEGAGAAPSRDMMEAAARRTMGDEEYERVSRLERGITVTGSSTVIRSGKIVRRSQAELDRIAANKRAAHDLADTVYEGIRRRKTGATREAGRSIAKKIAREEAVEKVRRR